MSADLNTAEPGKPRLRSFRFGLRTMLIGVTLAAVAFAYVGRQVRAVAERKHLRAVIDDVGGYFVVSSAPSLVLDRKISIPWIRERFGDEAMAYVAIPDDQRFEENSSRVEKAFPEADVGRLMMPLPESK